MQLTAEKRHQFDREEFYGDFAVTLGWQQNFSPYRLSSYFFKNCGSITVGSNTDVSVNTTATPIADIRASDLGLSSTFTGSAWLCPKYQDFIADFDLYLAWDEFVKGLWTELRVPFVHTRWNAGLGTSVTNAGGEYYASQSSDHVDQYQYMVESDLGTAVEVVYTGACALSSAFLGNSAFGEAPALTAGKIINCRRTANGLGGIRLALGYDFLRRERGSMGLAVDVIFPAANQLAKNNCCCNLFIFDPSIGAQHSWKVGGVLRGQYMLWDKGEDERIDLYLDGRVYGGFSGQTTRLLGLTAGGTSAFNHYLLLEKYSVSANVATYESLERAANLLKARVKANSSVEAQATAMFQYKNGGFTGALGYNFYGRNAEKVCLCCLCSSDPSNYYYVIKGGNPIASDDGVYHGGFYSPDTSNIAKTGEIVTGSEDPWGELAADTVTGAAISFTTSGNLNLCTATHPKYISNTIFGHLAHTWEDVDWKPYIGVLGKVDIGSSNTALRLWGVYLKGGICF
jgi:hypothetical protein